MEIKSMDQAAAMGYLSALKHDANARRRVYGNLAPFCQ